MSHLSLHKYGTANECYECVYARARVWSAEVREFISFCGVRRNVMATAHYAVFKNALKLILK